MTYLIYKTNSVFGLINRWWCMMFHKQNWEPYGNGEKCSTCGEVYEGEGICSHNLHYDNCPDCRH